MAKYELSDHMVKNLLQFLNRTPVEGFAEQDAMYEIRYVLSKPLEEDEPKK
ncbi:hypothetical protein M5W83_02190 [Paenibacillus thiaminolyticus]|uniref:Uncharacterized protein n=1 Tax=Paenibacillus thiaminolyticus TaxID=49283 RepID=A0ABT4FSV2_PANTH|nr:MULTISPECIES: hypothetical protein [Paenibacillus]MCY9538174.1 hypothetical protein [Paenibacillus thiaminolyticus]MCY9602152.1 hypothetical protein [Paenibacillus thiaminolyticus]MCY9605988.1 hypothetical protein [Paenibacillus thiaminolyticus]MCY9612395.1 hypothetical protein [Paenibacillus thiaminolyticus]MCY9621184.1 hypothetical protein [Paenibacillus thiaminolyticus]